MVSADPREYGARLPAGAAHVRRMLPQCVRQQYTRSVEAADQGTPRGCAGLPSGVAEGNGERTLTTELVLQCAPVRVARAPASAAGASSWTDCVANEPPSQAAPFGKRTETDTQPVSCSAVAACTPAASRSIGSAMALAPAGLAQRRDRDVKHSPHAATQRDTNSGRATSEASWCVVRRRGGLISERRFDRISRAGRVRPPILGEGSACARPPRAPLGASASRTVATRWRPGATHTAAVAEPRRRACEHAASAAVPQPGRRASHRTQRRLVPSWRLRDFRSGSCARV